MFGGKFDPQSLHRPYSLIPALKKMSASDIRDSVAIHHRPQLARLDQLRERAPILRA